MKKLLTNMMTVLALSGLAATASADVITFTLGDEVSGSGGELTAPVIVTLDDEGTAGSVLVEINLDFALTEYLSALYLNFNPDKDVTALTLTTDGTSDADYTGLTLGAECCKPDGQAEHDIQIDFPSAGNSRFEGTETYSGVWTGLGDLVAADFAFLSASGNCAIARVRSTGADGQNSGWFDCTDDDMDMVEPGTLGLLGLGLAGLGFARRRRAS